MQFIELIVSLGRLNDSGVSQNKIIEERVFLIDLWHKSVLGKELEGVHEFLDLLIFTQLLSELRSLLLGVLHVVLRNGDADLVLILNLPLQFLIESVAHW